MRAVVFVLAATVVSGLATISVHTQTPAQAQAPAATPQTGRGGGRGGPPDFDRQVREQADTDKTWRAASDGFMQMDKITYRS